MGDADERASFWLGSRAAWVTPVAGPRQDTQGNSSLGDRVPASLEFFPSRSSSRFPSYPFLPKISISTISILRERKMFRLFFF